MTKNDLAQNINRVKAEEPRLKKNAQLLLKKKKTFGAELSNECARSSVTVYIYEYFIFPLRIMIFKWENIQLRNQGNGTFPPNNKRNKCLVQDPQETQE